MFYIKFDLDIDTIYSATNIFPSKFVYLPPKISLVTYIFPIATNNFFYILLTLPKIKTTFKRISYR